MSFLYGDLNDVNEYCDFYYYAMNSHLVIMGSEILYKAVKRFYVEKKMSVFFQSLKNS